MEDSDYEQESESDRDETDSISSEESIDIEGNEKKLQLLEQKFKLIVRYNANAIDIDEFRKSLKNVNNELESIEIITEYSDSNLVNLIYNFVELLYNYSQEIKNGAEPGFLSDLNLKKMYNFLSEIKSLSEKLVSEKTQDEEPLDSRSLDDVFESLIREEEKYLTKILVKINKTLKKKNNNT